MILSCPLDKLYWEMILPRLNIRGTTQATAVSEDEDNFETSMINKSSLYDEENVTSIPFNQTPLNIKYPSPEE
ncbi:hypothetical protein E1A91_D10G067200v1 [Gossypium mustelinum]|uniref:Uncharacterized protein n=1 Tax=Gossypium mustelinum TaxID=34275 RepID=A0A5D2T3X1_GOSMU|nr:hypothetical protein E1A91_D10G067200v1 [Gossypium mustelinum]